ncbi:MAG: GHKL domain-containing protein [Lachnospiraceae bacterium]|nr:GHKL domain-containing protein [Lachnospiraceae bacterium]
MNDIAEIIASLAESYIVVRLCNRSLGFKNKNMALLKSVVFFIILAAENILTSQKEWKGQQTILIESLTFILFVSLIGMYVFLFLNGKTFDKLLITIIPAITILPINLTILSVIRALSGEFIVDIVEPGGKARIWALVFSKLAFFLVCEFVIHMRKRNQYSLSIFQWSIQLSCFLITFLIAYLQFNISMKTDNMSEFLPVSILIMILNILLYVLLDRMNRDSMIKEEYRISRITLAAQERLVDEARKQYMEMKTLRHDMRHYLMTAAELIGADQTEEAKDYIEKIVDEKVDQAVFGIDTGDVVIDAVINSRIAVCLKNHIEMKCMIDSQFKGINDIDMSVLLSNALDNAISGCAGAESATIELIIGTRKAFTYIIVKNSIKESVLAKNPDLKTDKENKTTHGFGIMSIRKIVEKYKGSVEFKEEDHTFIVEIWLENVLPSMR